VLLDRTDGTRASSGTSTSAAARVPRELRNSDEVRAALEAALAGVSSGVGVRTLRAADLPLSEQVKVILSARGLIGVHGAGLTHALSLPAGAGLLELLPTAEPIPNFFTLDETDVEAEP
jgi:capsular polysaccharide biosynthesis protein